MKTAARYALFQIPDILVLVLILIFGRHWLNLPGWSVWVLIGVWVGKDIITFYFVWRLYEPTSSKGTDWLIGADGIAEERLAPAGYIRVHGELWRAEVIGSGTIQKGERVHIQRTRGLTLLVVPEEERE